MTIAHEFESFACSLPRDERGFARLITRKERRTWEEKAVKVEYPYGTGSFDPTMVLTFSDGSRAWVSNSRQECYPYRVSEIDKEGR